MPHIIVIGAGAVGVCCAYYLRKKGFHVTVVDRGRIGAACSAGNAGLIVPSHVIPLAAPGVVSQGLKWLFRRDSPFYIRPRLDPALWSWVWRFTRHCNNSAVAKSTPVLHDLLQRSAHLFDELFQAHEQAFYYRKKGLLMVYRQDKYRRALQQDADTAAALGIAVRHLSQQELVQLEPHAPARSAGAFYYPNDAHLDPTQFIQALVDRLSDQGVTFLENTEVTGLEQENGQVTGIAAASGPLKGDMVLIASGSWSPLLAGPKVLPLPVEAGKGYSITLDQPKITPTFPMILSEEKATITPLGDRIRFAGTLELSGLDHRVNRARFESVVAVAPQYQPDFQVDRLDESRIWHGFRPCTPDGLPIIGRSKRHPNLLVATGHAMLGITLAPITGSLIANLAAETGGEQAITLNALSPFRFSH
ncbi:NAD(P)/FAD-dependent oxidoreductase [Acanthopleuribacter pedis]|uniref:FAD-dependent oxidoreductase n=1 Tax=Acanthopleuribacter pedis TaxID=442870 RepID=A0A8J7QF21_9BACT|nr:FAD-dependent oxidoreductase [Acanthopleuribacter pedis]MBO1322834.1 FAD-dependent oxidoreductase [Acanthopleuribacter pedis]